MESTSGVWLSLDKGGPHVAAGCQELLCRCRCKLSGPLERLLWAWGPWPSWEDTVGQCRLTL